MPLAIAAAAHYLGADPFLNPNGSLQIADRKIAFDTSWDIYLDFYGIENTFTQYLRNVH
jgi:hypothetical protein